jgi:hypothetical protein
VNWKRAPNDEWEIVYIDPDGSECFLGTRLIDGSRCDVFLGDHAYLAQMSHMTRVD